MKFLTASLLVIAFLIVPMVAGASGDFQEGRRDGKVAARKDFGNETVYDVFEVPQWRMERISNRSDEYIRGYRSGYLEVWENLTTKKLGLFTDQSQ